MRGGFEWVTKAVFALGGMLLMGIALGLMIYAPITLVQSFMDTEGLDAELFRSIGYLIVAIAVFDVAKYIFEEEVLSNDERRNAAETRRSLTKFGSTIVIAVLLEGLVMTFEIARDEPADLIYPVFLMLAGTGLFLAIAIFQRLSASTERMVNERDPEAATTPPKPSARKRA
jgi:formate hydrogenlyase subunit 3/multisubunit Na+/H+ antiporter MnhD subunit